MLEHHVPCHVPSFKTVFIKHASVVDTLCNHKSAIEAWSLNTTPKCCCQAWHKFRSAALNPDSDHWVLSGSLLTDLLPPEVAVLAEYPFKTRFSLNNGTSSASSIVASSAGANSTAYLPFQSTKFRTLASTYGPHTPHSSPTISLVLPFNTLNNCSKGRSSIARTNVPHPCEFSVLASTARVLARYMRLLMPSRRHLLPSWSVNTTSPIHGLLGRAVNFHQATFWPRKSRTTRVAGPSSPLWMHPSDPCSTSWLG